MKNQFPWYGKAHAIREIDQWKRAVKIAYQTRYSDSPIRYNVTTSVHDKIERKRIWHNKLHPHSPINTTVKVIHKDKYLTFYARTEDNYWRPYKYH